ncbi:hypothetical protein VIGAN_09140300, partial [Vigna angularis var. angularis]
LLMKVIITSYNKYWSFPNPVETPFIWSLLLRSMVSKPCLSPSTDLFLCFRSRIVFPLLSASEACNYFARRNNFLANNFALF